MKTEKAKKIKPELRGLLNKFLEFEGYDDIFKQFAKALGYHGNDRTKIKKLLFLPNEEGEIIFSVAGMYDLFEEYQLMQQLIPNEPYKTLLTEYPEAIQHIHVVARKMLEKKEVTNEDIELIFNTEFYDENRRKIDSAKRASGQQDDAQTDE